MGVFFFNKFPAKICLGNCPGVDRSPALQNMPNSLGAEVAPSWVQEIFESVLGKLEESVKQVKLLLQSLPPEVIEV